MEGRGRQQMVNAGTLREPCLSQKTWTDNELARC